MASRITLDVRYGCQAPGRNKSKMLFVGMMLWVDFFGMVESKKFFSSSDASSTVLRVHRRYYMNSPPHDRTLYDLLQVEPNATLANISKAYRSQSRRLHPDKQRQRRNEDSNGGDDSALLLQRVRDAYEILNEDSTRVPYHKYGLIESTNDAAHYLLTGTSWVSASDAATLSPDQRRLLELMGLLSVSANDNEDVTYGDRILGLAMELVETVRPLVEGTLTQQAVAHEVAQECDKLKKCALGAQIIRCIGRAYRHSGQGYLMRHQDRLGVGLSEKWRDAKHLLTAAMASGKLVLTEKQITSQQRKRQRKKEKEESSANQIQYHEHDFGEPLMDQEGEDDSIDDLSDHIMSDEDIRQFEQDKAQNAELGALEIEAVWKLRKVELDRTIRQACQMILEGEFFGREEGWVGTTGQVIETQAGQLRAAAALVW
eukprot:CAMPEP_0198293134 /NCGR_PEP_ID=MMETSP1449-20131203/15721_1 /TAXON_ID=420275 /ORGANISM="Attheya septentrionalis, Strain CCMP2084" /LENGTH=428 /DNA_ID=CAMNT_0043992607 /DNA_START=49 /DNA_END=1332 /DNA_ORIENTATION=+